MCLFAGTVIRTNVNRVLFGDAFVIVHGGHGGSLLDQPGVGDARMIHIVDQSGKHHRKQCQRIGRDPFGVPVGGGLVVGRDHPGQHFRHRHGHMAGVHEVVEGILGVHGRNADHVLSKLRLHVRVDVDLAGITHLPSRF